MREYSAGELDAIVLDSFEELTYKTKFEVTDGFSSSRPLKKYADFLIKTLGGSVYNKIRGLFYSEDYRKGVLLSLEKKRMECVTYFSEDYPERLRSIPAPPLVLYCRGNTSLLNTRCFGIVGSRRTLTNILKECKKISGQIAEKFTVVTGTADGADTAAAEGAVQSGNLIFVCAQGLDHIYPAGSAKLYKEAAASGLVISEQRPEVPAMGYLFPVRNRLIAALSEGVLVVSAGKKSGASITAEYAFEYGRDVFCFPYSIGVPSGVGCNRLIKKGAYLAENILDIFDAFGLDFTEKKREPLTPREEQVLSAIRENGSAHISEIASKLGCNGFELLAELSSLEVKGLICRLGGNRYASL